MSAKKKHPLEPSAVDSPRKPGNVNPDNILPEIWSTRRDDWLYSDHSQRPNTDEELQWSGINGGWIELLVCRKRLVHSKDLMEEMEFPRELPPRSVIPNRKITSEILYFPVAILLTYPVKILYGLQGNAPGEHRKWIVNEVGTRGMGLRPAQAALASAWRGVDQLDCNWPERNKLRFKYSVSARTLGVNTDKPQELTLLRDVALWIHWNHWDFHKLPMARRAEILQKWGFPCTLKALRQVKDGAGI